MGEVGSGCVRTGLWRWLRGTGLERFELQVGSEGTVLRGTVLTVTEQGAAEARYEVVCDAGWRTQRAQVWLRLGDTKRELSLKVEGDRWLMNGRRQESVRGCFDVDLGWTPVTNTLPIRRLGLAVGESSGPITAAWVRFPELSLEPLPQEYRRLSETCYRYSSRGGAFQAELEVDADGLVVNYERGWERVEGS